MSPAQALNFLRGPTTEEFLKHYYISIAGAPGPSGVVTYHIGSQTTGHQEFFKIAVDPVMAGTGSFAFQAHSVYMVDRKAPRIKTALDGYVLDGTGPDIMVTGMLNGCSFLMKAGAGGTVRCAHLQPGGEKNAGQTLHVDMMNGGQFHTDAGNIVVFGRNHYPASATVIGVRKGGAWQIFQQSHISMDKKVTGATRIL